MVTSLLPKIQGVAIFLLKKPFIIGFINLFLYKVLTIRDIGMGGLYDPNIRGPVSTE